jgi:beta-barrel assembly-enhancing protease
VAGYPGRFSDGRVATSRVVELRLGATGLEIVEPGDALVTTWPYESLRRVDEPYPGRPLRLASSSDPEGRLTIDDPLTFEAIHPLASQLADRTDPEPRRGGWHGTAIGALLAVALGLVLCRTVDLVAIVPSSWENALGRGVVAQVAEGREPCAGRSGVAALQSLTDRLAAASGAEVPFVVHVLPLDVQNAFAAPGGHIVLLEGLLDQATSPDEVAGVLAHEMAHVLERDPTRNLIRTLGLQAVLSAALGGAPDLVRAGAEFGGTVATLSYNRSAEEAADARAVELLAAAGLRTGGLAEFFDRLERESGSDFRPPWLSSHPPTPLRAQLARERRHDGAPALDDPSWIALRAICKH